MPATRLTFCSVDLVYFCLLLLAQCQFIQQNWKMLTAAGPLVPFQFNNCFFWLAAVEQNGHHSSPSSPSSLRSTTHCSACRFLSAPHNSGSHKSSVNTYEYERVMYVGKVADMSFVCWLFNFTKEHWHENKSTVCKWSLQSIFSGHFSAIYRLRGKLWARKKQTKQNWNFFVEVIASLQVTSFTYGIHCYLVSLLSWSH